MYKYPEINQFRQAIRNVKWKAQFVGLDKDENPIIDPLRPPPTIKYQGTVKLHGTNGGIIYEDEVITPQSRNNGLTLENDNAGFAKFVDGVDVMGLLKKIPNFSPATSVIKIYGEWCGQGIQKGVAINELPKMYVIFSVKVDSHWLTPTELKTLSSKEDNIYNIMDFPTFEIDIDFNNPEISQNKMIAMVEEVENECPVGKAFGVSGIGEGIVFKPVDPSFNSSKYWFKVKGEKHSVTKVKKLAAIDVEKVKTINEFVDKVVTENRLQQAISVLKEGKGDMVIERKHIGDIIRWVYNDVLKEETDTIEDSGLKTKELGGPIAKKAKAWFFANELNI